MSNIFKKQSAKFVQNPSSFTKVMAKHILVCFLCPTVYIAPRSLEESGRVDEDILSKMGSRKGMGRPMNGRVVFKLSGRPITCRAVTSTLAVINK